MIKAQKKAIILIFFGMTIVFVIFKCIDYKKTIKIDIPTQNTSEYVKFLESNLEKKSKHMSDQDIEKLKNFLTLKKQLLSTPFIFKDGKVIQRNSSEKLTAENEELLHVANKAFSSIKGNIKGSNGLGVLVIPTDNQYEVIMDFDLKVGMSGPDYSFKIILEKKTLNVLSITSGS